jgi:hypothetical protein
MENEDPIFIKCIKKEYNDMNLTIGRVYRVLDNYIGLSGERLYIIVSDVTGHRTAKCVWKFKVLPNTKAVRLLYEK